MKIAIGFKLQNGPFGGGNQFARSLVDFLIKKQVKVVFSLEDSDIDLILLTDPRSGLLSNSFDTLKVAKYLRKNNNAIVVHRVNECDERKNTKTINKQLCLANSVCDHTVYIASWLIELFKRQNLEFTERYSVILNGADRTIFKNYHNNPNTKKIRIVTHHWGVSYQKGWDIYAYLDQLLLDDKYSNIEFHYIGKPLDKYKPQNIIMHSPLSGKKLGEELSKNDIYLTASINEPAGMHHIEGALCGLPLLYRNSGGLPEYCDGFGVMFNGKEDFQMALDNIIQSYGSFNMEGYSHNSELMAKQYFLLFKELISHKEYYIKKRERYSWLKFIKLLTSAYRYKLLNRIGVQ